MKKELEKQIIYTFLSSKYKLLTANTISRESKISLNVVIRFVKTSNLIVEAQKRTRRGEILYYLSEEARSLYKLEKRDFSSILDPVKALLSAGNLHGAIKEFYTLLKTNQLQVSKSLIEIYKDQLTTLSTQYYTIETRWKAKELDNTERFYQHDQLVFDLFELLIGFELLSEELDQYKFSYQDISIKLDRDFNQFSEDDSSQVLQDIAHLLNMETSGLRLKSIARGSVIMTLELDDTSQAEKLFLLIKLGKLKQQGVIDARLRELTANTSSAAQGDDQLLQLCDRVKSVLKKGKTEKALDMLDQHLELIDEDFHNTLLLLSSDFSSLNEEMTLGVRDYDSARVVRNKITFSVLNLVDKIKKSAAA